jgi:flagella basal body P-ring formation protein FlgA
MDIHAVNASPSVVEASAGSPLPRPRRQSLPGGRAVVGGLLVAAAAVGTYAAHGAAVATPGTRYVVAAHDVAPGRALVAGDLTTVAIDLPGGTRAVSFTDARPLDGAVTLGALRAGQLIAQSVQLEG